MVKDNKNTIEQLDDSKKITEDELQKAREIAKFQYRQKLRENQDKKEDQIRAMAWFALWGMLLYPVLILVTSFFDMLDAATIIGDIAPTYFVAIAGLVASFFGATAYMNQKSNDIQEADDEDYNR